MADQWFYTKDGRNKVGPVSFAVLQKLVGSGVVQPVDMVNQEGNRWSQAQAVPGLLPVAPTLQSPVAIPVQMVPPPVAIPVQVVPPPIDQTSEKFAFRNFVHRYCGGWRGRLLIAFVIVFACIIKVGLPLMDTYRAARPDNSGVEKEIVKNIKREIESQTGLKVKSCTLRKVASNGHDAKYTALAETTNGEKLTFNITVDGKNMVWNKVQP